MGLLNLVCFCFCDFLELFLFFDLCATRRSFDEHWRLFFYNDRTKVSVLEAWSDFKIQPQNDLKKDWYSIWKSLFLSSFKEFGFHCFIFCWTDFIIFNQSSMDTSDVFICFSFHLPDLRWSHPMRPAHQRLVDAHRRIETATDRRAAVRLELEGFQQAAEAATCSKEKHLKMDYCKLMEVYGCVLDVFWMFLGIWQSCHIWIIQLYNIWWLLIIVFQVWENCDDATFFVLWGGLPDS